jgi:hypothetical protein
MKIISKFRDYYDNISHQYLDKDILYLRKNQTKQLSRIEVKRLPKVDYFDLVISEHEHLLHQEFICFCGKVIPVITLRKMDLYGTILLTFYDATTLEQYLHQIKHPLQFNQLKWRHHSYLYILKSIKNFFARSEGLENLEPYYRKWNTPCFVFRRSLGDRFEYQIEINPCLREYNFAKIRDPFSAHQELYMFVSGVLNQPERPMVAISDSDKIHKHGFDKYSFRKLPTKKNK